MALPISFEEVSYFNNEYRGDLIVTSGVLYFVPHTRVKAARFSDELGHKETADTIGLIGNLVPGVSVIPWAYQFVDKGVKFGKYIKRTVAPTINNPNIKGTIGWNNIDSEQMLQRRLDNFVIVRRAEMLDFEEDSVPKPMRFALEEVKNLRLGFKLRFDTEYDNHDFRVSPLRRNLLRSALKESGFLE